MKKYLGLAIATLFIGTAVYGASILSTTQGGTGTGIKPTVGQVLVGQSNGTYAPQATSTLGLTGDKFSTTSINGLATTSFSFSPTTNGTDFTISTNATGTVFFNLPSSGASARGLVTSGDWNSWTNKLDTTTASVTYPNFSYASSTFVTFNYATSTFVGLSYANSTFPTFTYATSTFAVGFWKPSISSSSLLAYNGSTTATTTIKIPADFRNITITGYACSTNAGTSSFIIANGVATTTRLTCNPETSADTSSTTLSTAFTSLTKPKLYWINDALTNQAALTIRYIY